MVLDELRLIILNERESGKLSTIPQKAFDRAHEYLRSLSEEAYGEARSLEGFLSETAHARLEEMSSIKETLQEIVRLRTRKILLLALLQTENRTFDREEIKKMLPVEKAMFEEICREIEQCRAALLLDEVISPRPSPPVPPEEVQKTAKPKESPHPAGACVRILADTDAFMGVDGRIYELVREDIVTIPDENGEVLCSRNIALNIRLSK
jgi:DNA replication factor GINS